MARLITILLKSTNVLPSTDQLILQILIRKAFLLKTIKFLSSKTYWFHSWRHVKRKLDRSIKYFARVRPTLRADLGGRHGTEVAFVLLTQPSQVRFLCQLVKIESNNYPRTCCSKLFGVSTLRKVF